MFAANIFQVITPVSELADKNKPHISSPMANSHSCNNPSESTSNCFIYCLVGDKGSR